jgi:hypothetical protein
VRAGDLKAKPFVDAATAGTVSANQQLNIVGQQGAWVQVEANGTTGWMRMMNVKRQSAQGSGRPPVRRASASAGSLFTGSSGKTVTTGIKGVDDEDIKNSTPDMGQVAKMASLSVESAEATANARQNGLREYQLAYLKEGKGK